MTFWQDARPIPTRPRVRPSDRGRFRRGRGGRRRRPRARLAPAVVVVLLVGAIGIGVTVIDRGPAEVAAEPRVARASAARWRAVPARWTRTLPDTPQELLVDGVGVLAIGNRSATALGLDTGAERWHVPLDRPNPWAAASDAGVVISTAGGFVGLDRASGRVRWTVPTAETPGPVALADGVQAVGTGLAVVTTREGGLVALDAGSGAVRWSLRLPDPPRGAPALDAATATAVVVTGGEHTHLRALDLRTGAPRWDREVAAQTGAPVVSGEAVLLGAGDGASRSALGAYSLSDGTPRWVTAVPASFQPGLAPAVAAGDAFVLDQLDHLTRIEVATGRRRWTRDLHGAALVGAPVVVGDAVLVVDALRTVVTVDRGSGRVLTRRAATGVPVRLVRSGPVVVLAQRLVQRDHITAYPARLVASVRARSARSRE